MKKTIIAIILGLSIIIYSCDLFNDITTNTELTPDDIVKGLKEALSIGTDSATNLLSASNGYYQDALVKILLPEEAQKVKSTIDNILGVAPSLSSYLNLDKQFENVVLSINQAAENAASEAGGIFKTAITGMSISEGLEILKGSNPLSTESSVDFDSTSATKYFQMTTTSDLTGIYAPKIDKSLDKNLGLGFSANEAWSTLRNSYNTAVNTITGNVLSNLALQATGYKLDPLETESIGEHCTEKALDGLFLKVGNQEKKIRKDPFKWASDIIQKVFGHIFDE